jgi:hypothetical protein
MSMRRHARSAGAQITQRRTHELALPAPGKPGKGYAMSLLPGRPKEGSLPLGGKARSAKGAH